MGSQVIWVLIMARPTQDIRVVIPVVFCQLKCFVEKGGLES